MTFVTYRHIYQALCNSSVDPLCAPFLGHPSLDPNPRCALCAVSSVEVDPRRMTQHTEHTKTLKVFICKIFEFN